MQDCNYLYALAFTVGGDSGIALVSARSEADAMQILRNSGKYNGVHFSYIINKIKNIGLTSTIRTELLLESYVNAMGAFDALIREVELLKGDKGDKGDPGDVMSAQSDWTEEDVSKLSFIKNKPFVASKLSELESDSSHRTVTDADITKWTNKQNAIPDIDDIRAGAEEGYEANVRIYNSVNPNGLGYIALDKDKEFEEQVIYPNTIYEIRYDYDLNDSVVPMPSGCVLNFVGGSISNGTITGAQTVIEAGDYTIFDNIVFAGSFKGALNAVWVGAKQNDSSYDNSVVIQAWFDTYAPTFRELYFPEATYYFLSTASLITDKRNLTLNGGNSRFNVNIAADDAYFLKLQNTNTSLSSGEDFRLQDVKITNVKTTSGYNISKTRCLLLDRSQRFNIQNVGIWYFDIGVHIFDVWYGGFSCYCLLRGCYRGIVFNGATSDEVNTIDIPNVDFSGITRAAVAALYPQQQDEAEDAYLMRTASCGVDAYVHLQAVALRGCVFEGFDYGIRANYRRRSSRAVTVGGPLTIDGCYFENNRERNIYAGPGNADEEGEGSSYHYYEREITISNCRFYTIKSIYLLGVVGYITGNQEIDLYAETDTYVSTNIDYDGQVNIKSVTGSSTLRKIGKRGRTIRNADGTNSIPLTGYQVLQEPRYYGVVTNRLNGYSRTTSSPSSSPSQFKDSNFNLDPSVRLRTDIMPYDYFNDADNSYNRLLVPSGNSLMPVTTDSSYHFRAVNTYGDITLFEFIRRWKAGTAYTGTVKNLFPFTITADPVAGTVKNTSGKLVGFGIKALGSTVTTGTATGYYIFVDALIWVRISYSRIKFYADALQCGRLYSELRGTIDEASSYTAYLSVYGSNTNMANAQKRINAVYYNTTNTALYIYNGFGWVEMNSPFQRYYYKAYGLKLSERATMADIPGQTFTNYATGITYTFNFRANNNYKWVAGIGNVDSLDHPNGYDADDSLDYSNELSAGDQVVYNGALYIWNGTDFVANMPALT